MSKPCWQTISWGHNGDPETYQFDTFAERDAFLWGIQEGCGWMDYEKLEYGEGVHKKAVDKDTE